MGYLSMLCSRQPLRCEPMVPASAPATSMSQTSTTAEQPAGAVAGIVSSAALGVSFLAAAAPALCAVHCAAMPVLTILLPAMSASSQYSGKLLGGRCMHAFSRKLAIYFVAPFGLLSTAMTYPQHGNAAISGATLGGVASMVLAATYPPVKAYRNYLNLGGCGLMLGGNYQAHVAAEAKGKTSCSCCH